MSRFELTYFSFPKKTFRQCSLVLEMSPVGSELAPALAAGDGAGNIKHVGCIQLGKSL